MDKSEEIKINNAENNWEPKIVGFLCQWCSYAGADLAGSGRTEYPPNVRIIKVPCSGRVNPLYILRAFKNGADGVLVAGCHPGDCHYSEGNYYARRRLDVLSRILEFAGIEPERFRIEWCSASEGYRYASIIKNLVSQVKKLGPLNLKENNNG